MTHPFAQRNDLINRAVSAWMQFAVQYPKLVLSAMLILCCIALVGASRLGVDADSSKMLSPRLESQQRAAELSRAFPELKQSVVIVVRAEQSDSADIVVADLVARLSAATETIADVYAPAADPFMISNGLLYQNVDTVDAAMTRLSASSNLLAKLRTSQTVPGFIEALDDARALARRAELGPESLDRLYGETAAVIKGQLNGELRSFAWSSILADESEAARATRLITVLPRLDLTRLSPAKPALASIRSAIASLPPEQTRHVDIGVTGEPILRAEEMQSVLDTIGISLALSLVLVAAILWFGLRNRGRALLALASLMITLVLTTGFAGFVIGDLNLVSVAFIVLMVGLGIDFAIHIITHIAELRGHGSQPADAIVVTGRRMGLALILSAATTATAFLVFGTTQFAGMAQLGLIGAAGVVFACFVAMTLIPAMITLTPSLSEGFARPETTRIPASRMISRVAPVLVLVLTTAAIWPALSARFDADPMGLRDPDSSSVETFNVLSRTPETSPYRASILTRSREEAQLIAEDFANQEGIGAAIWLGDLVPEDQDEKLDLLDIAAPSIEFAIAGVPTDLIQRDEGEQGNMLAFRDALRAQNATEASDGSTALETALSDYLEVRTDASDTQLQASLFHAFDLLTDRLEAMLGADYITEDVLPAQIRDRFLNEDGVYRIEILPEQDLRNPDALNDFAERVRQISPDAAGGPMQLSAAGTIIAWSMLQATLLAALVTGLLAWVATRRITDVAAILLPLLFAGILTAATSRLLGMPFNYANVIVLPLLIGIGVDSGIHIALREHRAPGAVFDTSTPRAVIFSALTTMAAFGTLALSDHRGTASMGMLLAIAMTAAVVCVLAITPTVIRWTRQRT